MSSVTTVDDFIDTVDLLRDQILKCHGLNPPLAVKFRDLYFFKPPYLIYSFFLELSKYSSSQLKHV